MTLTANEVPARRLIDALGLTISPATEATLTAILTKLADPSTEATLALLNAKFLKDSISGTLVTIDLDHYRKHQGDSFRYEVNAAGGSGTKATLTLRTPNTATRIHLFVNARANVEAVYTLGEGPTITSSTGSNVPPIAHNRENIKAATVIGTRTAAVDNITEGATVTDFGTILEQVHFGNGKTGDTRDSNEWILAPDTVYAIEVESEAASSEVMMELEWYEV